MKVCLAATSTRKYLEKILPKARFLLESFFYFQDWQKDLIKTSELFLIDSGAYTFMQSSKKAVDWNEYLDRYIEFIKKYDIKYFFELDIDSIVGYEAVKKMTKKLEIATGKKCIPVFHKSRGLAVWEEMCKEYDYVAIGTIYEYKGHEDVLKYLLKIARKYKTKVHGLGFTVSNLAEFDFYSVDSTSWLSGARHGAVYVYKNGKLETHHRKNQRTIHYKKVDEHNLKEWIKYQNYLDRR